MTNPNDTCRTDGEAQSRHEHGTSDCESPYLWRGDCDNADCVMRRDFDADTIAKAVSEAKQRSNEFDVADGALDYWHDIALRLARIVHPTEHHDPGEAARILSEIDYENRDK
jgi:hypothetical protein